MEVDTHDCFIQYYFINTIVIVLWFAKTAQSLYNRAYSTVRY
jgi:hypothetical protein